jgi:hypothetical protein
MFNSMNSSGRSLIGKNCCCTWLNPTIPAANRPTVATTTTPRRRTQNDTARRTRYDIIARMRHDGCGRGASAGLTFQRLAKVRLCMSSVVPQRDKHL